MREHIDLIEMAEARLPLPGETPFWVAELAPLTQKLMSENDYCNWTWVTGGCFAFAAVLQKVAGGQLWGICEPDDDGYSIDYPVNHAMVKIGDTFYDFNGVVDTASYMARLEQQRKKEQVLKPKRLASWFDDEFLDDNDYLVLRKALSPLRRARKISDGIEESLVEADLRRFLAAAGAAGLIAGGAVAAHKIGGDKTEVSQEYSDDMPIFGDGDWAGPQEREQVQMAPGRGGSVQSEVTSRDVAYLAATIWGEARSEKTLGMRAVAHVIMNRARSQRWGTSLEEVVRRRKQFSCWNADDINRAKINRMAQIDRYLKKRPEGYERWLTKFQRSEEYAEYQLWLQAKKIARDVVAGNASDITDGALFYHTTAINPYWAPTMTPIKTIGNHTFLTDR